MRNLTRILLASSGAALAGPPPGVAGGQKDTTPQLPNVLLLVDTSGSMEYLIPPDPTDATGVKLMLPGSANAPAGSACNAPANTTVLNRWATLATVLTGTIPSFS